ncbi:hypothetical protein [Pararobbsia alpina]|uniref:hypothetical protein n=1 Tax=Pararobbsia alpina TaxID=621374 RepID=UPI00158359BA|nr:hypothetical protein [Pararobbsia alpina]
METLGQAKLGVMVLHPSGKEDRPVVTARDVAGCPSVVSKVTVTDVLPPTLAAIGPGLLVVTVTAFAGAATAGALAAVTGGAALVACFVLPSPQPSRNVQERIATQ